MLKQNKHFIIGIIVIAFFLSFIIIAAYKSKLTSKIIKNDYVLNANFANIGGLLIRAKVTIAGVKIGEVTDIKLDKITHRALVTMSIDNKINFITKDSTATILNQGVLGRKYIEILIGSDIALLKNEDTISDTQSALIIDNLVNNFLLRAL